MHRDPHWFSFINLPDFRRRSWYLGTRYVFLLLWMGASTLLLCGEIFVSVNLLLHQSWTQRVFQRSVIEVSSFSSSPSSSSSLPLSSTTIQFFSWLGGVAGWVVLGSTGLDICVRIWGWLQAWRIVQSDSIPLAFLSTAAFRLWSLKSYTHFCVLTSISWGHNVRQRVVLCVYFGLQGLASALITMPRLVVYGCILYGVKDIPGWGVSPTSLQPMLLESFTSITSHLMLATLIIIALSTIFNAIRTVRIVLAGILCTFTICCVMRIKKAMNRDLKSRITTLIHAANRHSGAVECYSGFQHETKASDAGLILFPYELSETKRSDQHNSHVVAVMEGGAMHYTTSDSNRLCKIRSEDSFHNVDLETETTTAAIAASQEPFATTASVIPSSEAAEMTNLRQKDWEIPGNSFTPPFTQGTQLPSSIAAPVLHPVSMAQSHSLATPEPSCRVSNGSTFGRKSGLFVADTSAHTDVNYLAPTSRLPALSFYDDLLKTISSERMMYASSLSNHGSAELQQQPADGDGSKRESNILSINSQSIAMCHSVPLSYCSQGSGCDERGSDRPIHPFDIDADIQPHVSATLHTPKQSTRPESDILASITDMYIHPLTTTDISKQSDINFQTSSQIQISVPDILSRSGSSRSQETIENWRIHVEPSSPVMHDLDYDFEKLQQGATDTAAQYARSQTGYVYDSEMSHSQKSRSTFGYQAEESQSRRETIPIILSSQLQDAFASHVPDQHFDIYADDDLDIPRPFYAYGQTRAQRQGSINSSIGGYNYSVASSPSLADSLSNPMYHQQTIGIMGGSPFGRAIPVRKGSLPSSIHSSIRDDASSRVQPTCSTSASKIRTRTPSHLSNMLNRGDKDIDSDREAGRATGHKRLPSVQMKSHFRNHSLGTHSSGHGSCSSWEDFRGYKGTHVSYATSVNIQTSYPQRMIYQERGFSIVPNQHINLSECGTAIDLKETSVVNTSTQEGYRSTCERESQYLASSPYTGEMADRFVQPVELSRSLIQPQSGNQREHRGRGYVAAISTPDRELHDPYKPSETQAAWSETCIGLGLTFATDTHQGSAQEGEISAFGTTDGSQLYQPIPVRRAPVRMDIQPNSNTWDNDFQSASAVLYEQAGSNTRMTSGLTITTTAITTAGSPDATTLTNASYRQQPMGAGTIFNDNDSGIKGQNTQHYHVQKQQISEQGLQRLEQSQRQKLYAVHHQTAHRSRKNLVVNIVPLMN